MLDTREQSRPTLGQLYEFLSPYEENMRKGIGLFNP